MKRLAIFLPLLLGVPLAQAECSRDDVQFYMEKGFTTEQIAQLCSAAPKREKKDRYQSYSDEYVDRRSAEYELRMRLEREAALRSAIDGTDIRLDQGHLSYIRKQCVSEGADPDIRTRLKSCPRVRYRIKLAGLAVDPSEYKKRVLFGRILVQVTGEIDREPLPDAFSDIQEEYWRDVLREKLETGDTTRIPLRQGIDFHFARGALEDVVAFETERAHQLAKTREDEGEGDDTLGDLGDAIN